MRPARNLVNAETSSDKTGASTMPAKICIVEDNPDSLDMITCMLRLQGYEIISATDGQEAIDLLQEERPDLIITDIQMPNVDGIELIRRLRSQAELSQIPILVMSAYRSGLVSEAIEAGANASTRKPVQWDDLLTMIKQLLPLYLMASAMPLLQEYQAILVSMF